MVHIHLLPHCLPASGCTRDAHVLKLLGLLLLLWGLLAGVESRGRGLLQTTRLVKPYNVCTSDWSPMVMCEDIEDPDDFTGYQIALFREISKDLGWQENVDWVFSCVDWNSMIDDLASPNGSCSFAAAGVEVITPNVLLGLKFSWPIYQSGYRILIAAVDAGGVWSFTQAFHWSVWLTLGLTALAISVLITAFELLSYGNRANRKGLRGWFWYCTAKMVQVFTHVGDPKTWASKVLVMGYACLALIMVHLFTATTASKMTADHLTSDIKGVHDLAGKKVETWEGYTSSLRKISTEADALPWDTNDDTQAFVDNLLSRKHQALVLDSATIMDMAAHAEHCNIYSVGDAFQTFELALAFPTAMDDGFISNISASILRLQTSRRVLDELENVFMRGLAEGSMAELYAGRLDAFYDHSCPEAFAVDATGAHHADTQISFQQVAGLWLILLIALGLAMLVTAAKRVQFHYWRKARRAKKRAATRSRLEACQARPDSQAGPDKLACDPVEEIPEHLLSLSAKCLPSNLKHSSYPHLHSSNTLLSTRDGGGGEVHADCVAEIRLPPGGIASSEGGVVQNRACDPTIASAAAVSEAWHQQHQQALRSAAELVHHNVNCTPGATEVQRK